MSMSKSKKFLKKNIIPVLLCMVTLLSITYPTAFAQNEEPFVRLITNPPTAVAGEKYNAELFRFCDEGYTHKVTYKLFVDDGEYWELDNYIQGTYSRIPPIVQDTETDSITVNGLTFDKDGIISGTPDTIQAEKEQQCIHFNAYVTWYDGERIVKSKDYNITYDYEDGNGPFEVSDNMKFRLYIVNPERKVTVGNNPKEIFLGDRILLTNTVENAWYQFTACSHCYGIIDECYISKKVTDDWSKNEYYPHSLQVYNKDGVPVVNYTIPSGYGGDDWFGGESDFDIIPGETYYIKVSCETKFGFTLVDGYSPESERELNCEITKVDYISTETFDPRDDGRFGIIPDDFSSNTVWNVFRVESNQMDWSEFFGEYLGEYGCGKIRWNIPLTFDTEDHFYFLYYFDPNIQGNYSAENATIELNDTLVATEYAVCMSKVDIHTKYTVDIYLPADKMLVVGTGGLTITDSTGNIIVNNPLSKSVSHAYRSNVTFTADVADGSKIEWFLDGQKRGEASSTFTVKNAKKTFTVKAVITDANGRITADEETVTINNTPWDKIVWFILHLFYPAMYEVKQ
ncbi:MAG TPA: hypothetical protein DDY98_00790 [Ruminococcaceae bacterium]|nr:hypothetical protein [Oscillospiraceae bacterium]